MSWIPCPDPIAGDAKSVDAIEGIIIPRARDVDGFRVERVLPVAGRRLVGPFIFFDQMGPSALDAGKGLDIRPHPHINLSTLTYLLDGEIRHRDSTGVDQSITPGALNLMTAGRGIVHSERSPEEARAHRQRIYGIQTWLALPEAHEEMAPVFEHAAASALPQFSRDGVSIRVLMGEFEGQRSPVATWGEPFYLDVHMQPHSAFSLPPFAEERGVFVAAGDVTVDGTCFSAQRMLIAREGVTLTLRNLADEPAHLLLLGGDIMDGPRHIWWNFVSSRKERIEQAKEEWRQGRFDTVPGDEEEFVPLPGTAG